MVDSFLKKKMEAFEAGQIGASLREEVFGGLKPHQLHRQLLRAGFSARRVPVPAPCDPNGSPRWWRSDGSTTAEMSDPRLVPEDQYAHADGGLVQVFPLGQPWRAVDPTEPFGQKSLLVRPATPAPKPDAKGRAVLIADTSPKNRVFYVTEDGDPRPRTLRAVDLKYDAHNVRLSRDLALEAVIDTRIPLVPGEPPELPFSAERSPTGTFTLVPGQEFWAATEAVKKHAAESRFGHKVECVTVGVITHVFFPGSMLVDDEKSFAAAIPALASLRVMLGTMVFQVDPFGYEGSVAHLAEFVKWILGTMGPCRVYEDGTGRNFSMTAPRFPTDLLSAAPLEDPDEPKPN